MARHSGGLKSTAHVYFLRLFNHHFLFSERIMRFHYSSEGMRGVGVCAQRPLKGPFTQASGNGERQRRAVVPLGILRLHRSGKPRGIYANDIPQIHPKFPPNRLVCMQMTPKTMALVQWHRKHEEEALLLLMLARQLRAERKR